MESKNFKITVSGITREEYLQATRLTAARLYRMLAIVMIFFIVVIILAGGTVSIPAFVGPLVVYLIVVAFCEIAPRINYKGQLENLDEPLTYSFNYEGWSAQMGNKEAHTFAWEATPKMKTSKDCLFLYNDDVTSNLIPLRVISPEELAQINDWYKNTRHLAKEYMARKNRRERADFRSSHQHLKYGTRGPAWGPKKRK